MQLINIGFGNMISSSRLITIVSPESAPHQADYPGGAGTGNAH